MSSFYFPLIFLVIIKTAVALNGAYGRFHLLPLTDDLGSTALKITAYDTSPSSIRSLAFLWRPDAFIELTRPVIVAILISEQNYNGNVTLTLRGERLTLKIDANLIRAFNLRCHGVTQNDQDFVYQVDVSSETTRAIIWRFVAWNEDDFTQLPVVSLTVNKNGTVEETLPHLSDKCHKIDEEIEQHSSENKNTYEDDDESFGHYSVVHGNFIIVASRQLATFGHADDYKRTAQFYSSKSDDEFCERCSAPCNLPVLMTLPAPAQGWEYGCRLNADDDVEQWWKCDQLGFQQGLLPTNGGLLGGIIARMKIASTLENVDPTSCLDVRHDWSPGHWQRYDDVTKSYLPFETANWNDEAKNMAYRCISSQDGTVLKDVYYDDGSQLVEHCQFSSSSSNNDAVIYLADNNSSVIELECSVLSLLAGCNVTTSRCIEKTTFTIEPAAAVPHHWEKASSLLITDGILTDKGSFFQLAINFSRIYQNQNIQQLVGDYNIFIYFQNNVTYLAGRFRIENSSRPAVLPTIMKMSDEIVGAGDYENSAITNDDQVILKDEELGLRSSVISRREKSPRLKMSPSPSEIGASTTPASPLADVVMLASKAENWTLTFLPSPGELLEIANSKAKGEEDDGDQLKMGPSTASPVITTTTIQPSQPALSIYGNSQLIEQDVENLTENKTEIPSENIEEKEEIMSSAISPHANTSELFFTAQNNETVILNETENPTMSSPDVGHENITDPVPTNSDRIVIELSSNLTDNIFLNKQEIEGSGLPISTLLTETLKPTLTLLNDLTNNNGNLKFQHEQKNVGLLPPTKQDLWPSRPPQRPASASSSASNHRKKCYSIGTFIVLLLISSLL